MKFQRQKPSLLAQLFCMSALLAMISACGPVTPLASPTLTTGPAATQTGSLVESTATAGTTNTPAPTALSGPSFTNPVHNDDFPDPYVLLDGDTYYAYATTNGSTTNIRVIRSEDLVHWEELGDALPALPEWSVLRSGFTWAPGVIEIEDQFLMYYVARDKEADRQCIGVAVSEDADGPLKDPNGDPFICQTQLGGSIDAYPYKDDDGRLYLLWKNDGNCCGLEVTLRCRSSARTGWAWSASRSS